MPIQFPFSSGGGGVGVANRNYGVQRATAFAAGVMNGHNRVGNRWYAVGAVGRNGRSPLYGNYIAEPLSLPFTNQTLHDVISDPANPDIVLISGNGTGVATRIAAAADGFNFAFTAGITAVPFKGCSTSTGFVFRYNGGAFFCPYGDPAYPWADIAFGAPALIGTDVFCLPLNRDIVLTTNSTNGAIWRSVDGGQSFAATGESYLGGGNAPFFAQNPDTGRVLMIGGNSAAQYSDDEGLTFSAIQDNPGRVGTNDDDSFGCAWSEELNAIVVCGNNGLCMLTENCVDDWYPVSSGITNAITVMRSIGNQAIGYAGQGFYRPLSRLLYT